MLHETYEIYIHFIKSLLTKTGKLEDMEEKHS